MLLQEAAGAAHPLAGTLAEWIWLVPVLPFLGFIVNGLLSLLPATHMGPDPSAAGHGHESHGHVTTGTTITIVVRHKYANIVSPVGRRCWASRCLTIATGSPA
jgi:hypothetical protein